MIKVNFRLHFVILLLSYSGIYFEAQANFWERTNGPHGGSLYSYSFGSEGIVYAVNENGIFKSTDGGYNWNYFGLQEKTVYAICKTSSGTILCGVYGEGIYRSSNEGLDWTLTNSGDYIAEIMESENGTLFAGTNNGTLRSTNNGLNWTTSMNAFAFSLAESPIDGAIYGAATTALYRTTNSGVSWNVVSGLQTFQLRGVTVCENGYIFTADSKGSLSRSIDNSKTFTKLFKDSIYEPTCVEATYGSYVYCGTRYEGIWRSSDYGETWTIAGVGRDVKRLKRGWSSEIFASVPLIGCLKSTDNGLTWTQSIHGIVNTYSGSILLTNNGNIYSSSGQTSFDNGMNWNLFSSPIIVSSSMSLDKNSGYIYLANYSNQVHRSTDNGKTFSSFMVSQNVNDYVSVVFSNNDEVFASGLNLYKSTNNGVNWLGLSDRGDFHSFAVNNKNFYFGSDGSGIYRSTNLGQHWILVLPLTHGTLLPYNPIMITSDNVIYAGSPEGIYRSPDDGTTWFKDADLKNVSSLIQASNGKILASCYNFFSVNEGGVFIKENTWKEITYDLKRKNVLAMCFNLNSQLLVSTAGSGIFRTVNPVIGISASNQSLPSEYILHQNYPNPFNPETRIDFEINKTSDVSLFVFDATGKLTAELIRKKSIEAGYHTITFDAAQYDLASGIYFYKLTINGYPETKSMMFVK